MLRAAPDPGLKTAIVTRLAIIPPVIGTVAIALVTVEGVATSQEAGAPGVWEADSPGISAEE